MDYDNLTKEIIGAAIEVHRHLGAGLLESAYEACLASDLNDYCRYREQTPPMSLPLAEPLNPH